MGEYRRLAALVFIMSIVCLIVGATTIGVIYDAALDRERQRLVNIAQTQRLLLETLLDVPAQAARGQTSSAAWLEILEGYRRLREQGVGQTAELHLARREGDLMVFVTSARGSDKPPAPAKFGGPVGQPMTEALSGHSGTMIGIDYGGRRVLAAFEPIPDLGLGLVAKIDMAEINRDYQRAGLIAGLVSLAAVLGAALLFFRVGEPMVRSLRESEERYRNLVEAQPDPICQFLPDTTLTFVNRAYAEFYGRTPEELIGKRWVDFASRNERPLFLGELDSFTPEQPERHEETRTTRVDGETRWYVCHLYGFFDRARQVVSFQAFGTDITDRKQAEDELRESERRARSQLDELETIYRAAPIGLALYDRDLNFVRVNSALAELNGASIEAHLGRSVWEVVPHLREAVEPYFRAVLDEGRNVEFEASGEAPDAPGKLRHWLGHYYPLKGADGSVIAVSAIVQDITDRKRAEQALRESEARYRAAGEAIRYGVWICNRSGGVEFVSDVFLKMIGRTLDDVKPRGWLDHLPPEDVRPTLEAWRQCVRNGSDWAWEHRVKGRNGVWRTILSLGRPVYDDSGEITSWVGFNLDISRRKQAEEELRESEERLRGTFENAAVGIANVAPDGRWTDVNQRLCEILGYSRAEMLQLRFQQITHADDLPHNIDRFNALIRGEIDRYRLEKRYLHKDGHPVWVDLTSALRRDRAGNPAYCIAVIEDIGTRKRAEQALRESEARLRRTTENAPFPIMVHTDDGEVVHLSQAWLRLTGYTREQIVTIPDWAELAYGERKTPVLAHIERLYALDGPIDEGEYQLRTADGRTRIWAFSSSPLGSDVRGRRLVVTMAADVTERKAAERALRESEIRMRGLLDASQDEILLMSTHGEVLAINKAAEHRLARRTGGIDPIGAPLDRLLPPEQAEQRMAFVRQVAATATLEHWEMQIRARWFEFWFYPVLEADRPVTEVAVYAREITELKKSQAELNKLFQAIQQSPMSVVITNRDGDIEYVNPEFAKVTGYAPAEAIGQNARILQSGHTPRELYVEMWNTIASGGVWRGEFLNKKKSGELFWELASIAAVKDGDQVVSFVAVKEDITERKEIEEQLRQSQKMQAVGQLTGGIAHDFNNLLAIIIGNLQLLDERLRGDPKSREYLNDALWSARRSGELTHRLLAFARKQPLKPTVIDLNDIVCGITDLLRRTLGAGIHIEETLAPDLWKAFADRGELERALVNLAVNARDAMHRTGTLALETRNAVLDEDYAEQYAEVTPGEYVLLAVTDTGSGMPPEVLQRVFEPFFTTKEVGKGSGLGLSMVYGFIKQTGGHISLYSRVGHGTSVKLYLPRSVPPLAHPEEPSSETVPAGFAEKVVLVVEDEAKLRKVAVKMLDRLGLRSMQAETAKDALRLLADGHVDVLFTDIELPGGMNGTELADAVHRQDPSIKVLFTTGYAREAVLHERWLKDKVPWLLKPYSHLDLARELKSLLSPTIH